MKIKFHGARGSFPVPTQPRRVEEIVKSVWELSRTHAALDWPAFYAHLKTLPRAHSQIYGGNTTCVEIKSRFAPMPIFFDAGTGLSAAGVDPQSGLNSPAFKNHRGKLAIFFSHFHWDHIIGLPTLQQLYGLGNQFHFYGVHKNMEDRIAELFQLPHFPVPFDIVSKNFSFHQIPLNKAVDLGEISVSHHAQTHPGGSFAYRVDDGERVLVFATDTELKNVDQLEPTQNIFSNADALVLDAHFLEDDYFEGYGHSHIKMAVDFAVRENAKRLFLFHTNPFYNDHELDEQLIKARDYLVSTHPSSKLEIFPSIEGEEHEF